MQLVHVKADELSKRDLASVQRLAGQLGYPCTEDEVSRRLQGIATDQRRNALILAKSDDSEVIGMVHVSEHLSICSDSRAEITGLVVDECYRSQGIGSQLLCEVEKWSAEQGFPLIRFTSNIARFDAHKLYRRLGYQSNKTSHVFVKHIGQG